MKSFKQIREDGVVATNNIGSGAIAGAGVPSGPGPGEPPGPNAIMLKKKKKAEGVLRRKIEKS